jgi:hypothetical protein
METSELMIYDLGVSGVENYFRYCSRLRRDAETLASYTAPCSINHNGRVGSDEAILRQIALVKATAAAVLEMEKGLGITGKEPT